MKRPGLATPIRKDNDLLAATRKAFSDERREPRTLSQQMESLNDNELQVVLQTAQMVKMAASFHNEDKPYSAIVAPRGDDTEYKQKKMKDRDEVTDKVLDGYAAEMSKAGLK